MATAYFNVEALVTGGNRRPVILPDGRAGLADLVSLHVTTLNQYAPDPDPQTRQPPLGEYVTIATHGFALSGTLIGHHTAQGEAQVQQITILQNDDIQSEQKLMADILHLTELWMRDTKNQSHRHVLDRLNQGFANLSLTLDTYQAQIKEVVAADGGSVAALNKVQRRQRKAWTETLKTDRARGTQVAFLRIPAWDGPLEGLAEDPQVITVAQWLDQHWQLAWFDHWLTEQA